MDYTIENAYLKLTVTTWGAQVKSVVRKSDGVEHMWQAEPEVWGYHAPILFPYAGKLCGGVLEAKGGTYSGGQHGFARLMEHSFVRQSADTIVLELTDSPETLAQWPYKFRLVSTFTLEGDTLRHTLTVENRDGDTLRFGIGFHPAYAVPFDGNHQATDYELRFSQAESPLCLSTACSPAAPITWGKISPPFPSTRTCSPTTATAWWACSPKPWASTRRIRAGP